MHLNVPHHTELAAEAEPGAFFAVKGQLQAGDTFVINLSADRDNHKIPLHVSTRYKEGVVVLNSFDKGEWQKEERHKLKLKEGANVDVQIYAVQDKYQIFYDGAHLADFEHRQPLGNVKYLNVDGTIILRHASASYRPLALPHEHTLKPGAKAVAVTAMTEKSPSQFAINVLDQQGQILLHFNPRFGDKEVVRNSYRGGEWEAEERDGGLPIDKHKIFDVLIVDAGSKFEISIDGNHFASFSKRWQAPAHSVEVKGDLEKLYACQDL